MRNNSARSSSVSIVRKTRKKHLNGSFQTFDQKSVFNDTIETTANLLGTVVQGGKNPIVRVVSQAFKSKPRDFSVSFRNVADDAPAPKKSLNHSRFKRTIHDIKTTTTPPNHSLVSGDIVELQSCLIDETGDTLCPWSFRKLADAPVSQSILSMPEVTACLVSHPHPTDETKKDFKIAFAARAEATKIDTFLDNHHMFKSYLGGKTDMVNGFVLRGKISPGSKEVVGFSCYKSEKDVLDGKSDDEIILAFIKAKSHLFLNSIRPGNEWEIIPIYMVVPTVALIDRLQIIAARSSFLNFSELNRYDLKFVHANIVLDYGQSFTIPKAIHFNVSRSKPLLMDASLPIRATETRVKEVEKEDHDVYA